MYSEKQKNEFALLRAEGESFNSISKKLDIPIRTLFYWAKDMSGVISDLKIAAYESATDSLKASVNKRIQSLIITLNKIDEKLNELSFNFISAETLLKLKLQIHNELLKYEAQIYSLGSANKSQKAAGNDISADVVNEDNTDEMNSGEPNKMS